MRCFARVSALLLLTGLAACAPDHAATRAEQPQHDWAGSGTCYGCHENRHTSWARTYHRTMTQDATAEAVAGAFDGRIVEYGDQRIRPVARDGGYFFEYLDANDRVAGRAEIKRTVGSHRYQQYLAQAPNTGDNYIRMHMLWHIEDQRWVHMNGAFLYPDGQPYDQHIATWNHNCIYCHNTGPEPRIQNYDSLFQRIARGEGVNFLQAARYESQVAELGIACESCHGPAGQHVRQMEQPLTRLWYTLNPDAEVAGVVEAKSLSQAASTQICGQCHAQRQPADTNMVEDWLRTGPSYRAGDDLLQHISLVTPETPGPAGKPGLYKLRFWPDGTPRLSAYEYTGLREAKCFTESDMTCISCHEAHGGSPEGMISEANRHGENCVDCHADIGADVPAHTKHPADSMASQCVSCHMPKIVYGVMTVHRSHDIERPAPAQHAAQNRPDACTQCHVDKSASWAQAAIDSEPVGDDETPEWLKQLLGGDPVQRAIAAHDAGQPGLGVAEPRWLVPPLLHALRDDYPAVRRFAYKSLLALDGQFGELSGLDKALANYDFLGDDDERLVIERAAWRSWRSMEQPEKRPPWIVRARLEPELLRQLRDRAADNAQRIEIGE